MAEPVKKCKGPDGKTYVQLIPVRELLRTASLNKDLVKYTPDYLPTPGDPGPKRPTTHDKAETFRGTQPLRLLSSQMNVRHGSKQAIDAFCGKESSLEKAMLDQLTIPDNPANPYDFTLEGDTRRSCYRNVTKAVMESLRFPSDTRAFMCVEASEAMPQEQYRSPGFQGRADFLWKTVESTRGKIGDRTVLVGEFKNHHIIDPANWLNSNLSGGNEELLGKQARGYCIEYSSAAIFLYDGFYGLILVFKANTKDDLRSQTCAIEGFLFPAAHPDLRYALFRVGFQQLAKCQAETRVAAEEGSQYDCEPLVVDGWKRKFRWWSGVPYWLKQGSREERKGDEHPAHCVRQRNDTNAQWYWEFPDGREPIMDTDPLMK